jgi:hypothetical protein
MTQHYSSILSGPIKGSIKCTLLPILIGLLLLCRTTSEDDAEECVSFQWIPEATHPCTIERMTNKEFKKRFGPRGLPPLNGLPLVITSDDEGTRNQQFRDLTRFDHILDSFPDNFSVTLSSSNSFSEHRRTVPFARYLQVSVEGETMPDQLSNETWYLFGETYSDDWKRLLKNYEIPSCHACDLETVALSFGIGNRGSGVQWHVHGPGFSEAIHGRKHWVLQRHKPDFHPDQTSRNWMEYNYIAMSPEDRPLECTLSPGDLVYFPDMWFHATINLDPYTAFVSTFTQEHMYVDSREGFK